MGNKSKKPTQRTEDSNLARRQYPELNSQFYGGAPHHFFEQRLMSLMLIGGRPDEVERIMRNGVNVGGLAWKTSDDDYADEAAQVLKRERFIATEAETLLHHLAESLLRLYLAHEPKIRADASLKFSPCPWLDIVRFRSFSAFKERVRARFVTAGSDVLRKRQLAAVFYGAESPSVCKPMPPEEEWESGLANIEKFMAHLARHLLDRANLYNATKHGLAIVPDWASMGIDDGALISQSGPSITYLEVQGSALSARWNRTTTWIDIGKTLGFIVIAWRMLQNLWAVARLRYVGKDASVNLLMSPAYDELLDKRPIQISDMRLELLYHDEAGRR